MRESQFFPKKKTNMTGKELQAIKAINAEKGMPKRLRELRKNNNVTQKELANYIGCTAQAISAYETGANTPDAVVLRKYAEKFKVSADYLLGISDTQDSSLNKIVSDTRLSEKAVKEMFFFLEDDKCYNIINKLFVDKEFYKALGAMVQYVYTFDDLTSADFPREDLFEMYNLREWVVPAIRPSAPIEETMNKTDILMYTINNRVRRCMDRIKTTYKDKLRNEYIDDIIGQLRNKCDSHNPEKKWILKNLNYLK